MSQEAKVKVYKCTECGQTFRLGSTMRQHRKRKHRDQEMYYYCFHCPYKSKTNKSNLASHIVRMHLAENRKIRPPPPPNVCGLCSSFAAADRSTMLEHYKNVHDVQINEVTMFFNSWNEFLLWKKEIETKENSRYVCRVGSQRRREQIVVQYFRCYRDGVLISKGTGKRKPRVKGSIRSGTMCPASIRAAKTLDTGAVRVTYIDRHVGHSSEVGKAYFTKEQKDEIASMILSREEKSEIASKLSSGVQVGAIMDSIRESICKTQLKLSHGRPKDVWNTRNALHLHKGFMQRLDDRASVESWLAALDNYPKLVRFYKAQFSELPFYPELNYVDLVLILAFDSQLDLLQQFGNDCVCFDGTHGANGYAFELTTILVKDDKKEGLPCAFMISSRCDSDIMTLFVKVIKDSLKTQINPQVLVSDTSDVCYNAWCSLMPQPSRWLYSAWHVDQKWKQSLNMVPDTTKRCATYKLLRMLSDEPDENAFSITLARALATLFADSEMRNFADFFYRDFGANLERWAHCYCKYSGISADVFLEPMLKILKNFYLYGRKVKGLDKGIDSLMKSTRDKLVVLKKAQSTPDVIHIVESHDQSINLKNTIVVNENGWLIPSESKPYVYQVTRKKVICDCIVRCDSCRICVHEYACTCDGYKLDTICKHVHRIVTHTHNSQISSQEQPAIINIVTGESATQEICEEEPYIADNAEYVDDGSISYYLSTRNQSTNSSNTQFEGMKRTLLKDFSRLLENSKTVNHLEAIGKALKPLVPDIMKPSRTQK